MTTEHTQAEPLWQFATDLYAQTGMPEACLALQDNAGVDVCVLLYALYADAHGHALDDSELAQADQHIHALREQVILPLRRMRRHLKSGFDRLSPEVTAPVRAQVQIAELAAERLLLRCLHSFDQAHSNRVPRHAGAEKTVAAVVAFYAPGAITGASIPMAVIERAVKNHSIPDHKGDKP